MFDYHMHTTVSFDGRSTPEQMVRSALDAGLKEICFTDHIDHTPGAEKEEMVFDLARYHAAYDPLSAPGLKIRLGVEYGITPFNRERFLHDVRQNDYDFVIGSVHFIDGIDVYLEPYWEGKTPKEAYGRYLEVIYNSV